ncbi:MAG: hypothetical protein IT569_00970 [Leptospiraceae bacterium]|nr:hypothetical protein [Leptospiraceae bacterium]
MSKTMKHERISRKNAIILDAIPENVFHLFGAIDEKKWAFGWNPEIIFPSSGAQEEGLVFITQAESQFEKTYTWIATKWDPSRHIAEYTVSTQNRIWQIRIECRILQSNQTKAEIIYTYTSLNEEGKKINQLSLEKIFKDNLRDWERAINHYLNTGSILEP